MVARSASRETSPIPPHLRQPRPDPPDRRVDRDGLGDGEYRFVNDRVARKRSALFDAQVGSATSSVSAFAMPA